ncbi:MAG: hypothetical protein E7361_04270 [Clostridiales bacterium]|nr:hypothetical protein [Clostridiales bacterium]
MKTKQKVAIIAIVGVLLLAVIGLSIGLVLVAQQATMNNSMTISYTANNVDATITASGINYANATGTSDNDSTINIKDGETTKQSKTVTFNAEEATSTGGVEFVNADLTASGRAVYTFNIKNTANSSNKKEMKALATFSGISDNDNVSIFIGDTEASATEIKSATDKYFVNIGIGQATKTIVVVMKVTDATLDVNAFELNMEIELGYDLTDPNVFDWSSATTTDDLDIIWGIRNRSGADFQFCSTLVSNTADYVIATPVDTYTSDDGETCIDIYFSTTNTTDKFLVTATYLTLDDSVILTDSRIFDGSVTYEDYNGDVDYGSFENPKIDTLCNSCSVLKDGFTWGSAANNLSFNGGWYDTDIKIYIEITPYNQ